jgi:hypothetical protein
VDQFQRMVHSVVVSTPDFESGDLCSNPGRNPIQVQQVTPIRSMSDKQPILFLSKLGYARDGNKDKKEEKKE